MSGGHFDYIQHYIRDIADSIEDYIDGHELDDEDVEYYLSDRWNEEKDKTYVKEYKHTIPNPYDFSEETLEKMREGLKIIRKAYIYAQRIDWLLAGDDGEETFKERLEEELLEEEVNYSHLKEGVSSLVT